MNVQIVYYTWMFIVFGIVRLQDLKWFRFYNRCIGKKDPHIVEEIIKLPAPHLYLFVNPYYVQEFEEFCEWNCN